MLTPEQLRRHQFSVNALGFYKVEDVDSFFNEAADSYEQLAAECNSLRQKMSFLAQKLEDYRQDEGALGSALLVAQRTADKMVKEAKEEADKITAESSEKAEALLFDAKRCAEQTVSEANRQAKELTDKVNEDTSRQLSEASQTAESTVSAANAEAEKILSEARAESEEKLENANREAEDIIYKATGKAQEDLSNLTAAVAAEETALETVRREADKFRTELLSLYRSHIELIGSIPRYEEPETVPESADEEVAVQETEALDIVEELSEEPAEEVFESEAELPEIEEIIDFGAVEETAHDETAQTVYGGGFHLNLDEITSDE